MNCDNCCKDCDNCFNTCEAEGTYVSQFAGEMQWASRMEELFLESDDPAEQERINNALVDMGFEPVK